MIATHRDEAPALTRGDAACALVLALASLALYAATCLRGDFTGTISDAAVYLVLADHFSPYREILPDLGAFAFSRYPFPPLYPLVLGWFGGGSTAPVASSLLGAVLLGTAVGLYHLWLRTERVPAAAAVLLCVVFALLPATLVTALDIASEPLYLVLTLAGLVAIAAPPDRRSALAAALAFGLAACTRTAGIAMLAAFALAWPLRARCALRYWPPLFAALPLAGWEFAKRWSGFGVTYPLPTAAAGDQERALAAQLARIATTNLRAFADGALTSFDLWPHTHVAIALAGIGVLAAAGAVYALRRGSCGGLYVSIYLAMLLLWPHPAHARRFLFVVLPLLMAYAYLAATRRAGRRRALFGGFLIALFCLLAWPSSRDMLAQLATGEPERRSPAWYRVANQAEARRTARTNARMFRFMREAGAALPAEACVSAALPEYMLLYGHRRTEKLPPAAAGPAALEAALADCPLVLMMAVADYPPTGTPPMYPFAWIKDRMRVLAVEYLHPEARDGTVLAMLARVLPAAGGQ